MFKTDPVKSHKFQNATRLRLFLALCLLLATALIFSCRDKAEKSSYSEIKGFDTPVKQQEIKVPAEPPANPHAGMQMPEGQDPHAGIEAVSPAGKLTWQLPAGWTAYPGSGMFYAILKAGPGEDALEITIVAMAGEAGGLDANVERWLGQMGQTLAPPKRAEFIAKKESIHTQGGLDLALFDFGPLLKDGGAASMMVGVVKPGGYSFFIKAKGKKSDLEKQKKEIVVFCKSLAWKA